MGFLMSDALMSFVMNDELTIFVMNDELMTHPYATNEASTDLLVRLAICFMNPNDPCSLLRA